MSRSAERQDSFGQEVESRRDEGPWTREVWEWASPAGEPADAGSDKNGGDYKAANPPARRGNRQADVDGGADKVHDPEGDVHGLLLRHVVEKHDPVVSTTTSSTTASGEAHTASAQRFGFSPWQWAIGAVVLACGLYGAFWVKRKLAL